MTLRARFAGFVLVGLCASTLVVSSRALAQNVLLGVEGAAALPLAAPQSNLFGVGGSLGGVLLYPTNPWFLIGARLRLGLLSDGARPQDPGRVDPGIGGFHSLSVLLRIRPIGIFDGRDFHRSTDFWIELGGGACLTGDIVRPIIDVSLGYNFAVSDEVALGPFVNLASVIHFSDPVDSAGALLLQAGLELLWGDKRPPVIVDEVVEETHEEDRDSDGDQIMDSVDACDSEPEDADAFEDEDGCPEPDNDQDGVLDETDLCPLQPEDTDGFEDTDGCPELDNDHDGIVDASDQCPDEPEVVNGVDDQDGCPDRGLIVMNNDRIVLEEQVLFDFNRSRIKTAARPVLQAIVTLFSQHGEWALVRIEGHADARGDAEWNLQLSATRAERVRQDLIRLGIPEARIESAGLGATQPREEGTSDAAYRANRRVEFVVARREVQVAVPAEAQTP